MASEDFKDFLIGVGFLVDEAGAKKAQDTHAKVEAGITATAAAEAGKREAIEQKAGDARVSIAEAIMAMLKVDEERHTEARDKARKAEIAKDEAAALAAVKKQKERRDEAIKSAGKFALNVASMAAKAMTALEGMALGIFWAADKAAGGMEKLQYAAAWAGTTPKGINAFSYAAQQLGESAGEAEADLAKFGNTLKTIPAFEGVVKNLGIVTRDAKGNWRDMADIATEYMQKFKDMPKLQREARGAMLGLGENTMRVGIDGRFAGYERQYKSDQDAVGNDDDANGKRGAAFERSSRRLKNTMEGVGNRVMGGVMADLLPQLDKLQQWMADHGDQVAATLDRIAKDIIALANAVLEKLSRIDWNGALTGIENFVKDFDKIATGAFGESGSLMVPFTLFGAALLTKFVGPLRTALEVLGALAAVPLPAWLGVAGVAGTAATMAEAARVSKDDDASKNDLSVTDTGFVFKGKPGSGSVGGLPMADGDPKEQDGILARAARRIGQMFGLVKSDDPRVKDAILATADATKRLAEKADKAEMEGGGGDGGGGGVMGAANRFLGRARAAAGAGYTPAGGGGNTPAKGALAANQKEAYAAALKEGLSPTAARALVANMSGEGLAVPGDYHWDGTHMASGIVQWDPTRSAAIKTKFGAMPHQLSVADQTRAAIWEMKNKYPTTWRALQGNNGADMIGALVDDYERPGNRGRAKAQRMGYYRGFNPGDASPSAPTTSSPTGHIGDQAALDAQNRIVAGKGTPADHAIIAKHREQQNTPAPARAHPDDDRASRARASDASNSGWHLSPVQYTKSDGSNALTNLYKDGALKVEVTKPLPGMTEMHKALERHAAVGTLGRLLAPHLAHPLGVTPALHRTVNSHTKGNTVLNHNPTFNVAGGDTRTAMDHARLSADRGAADMLRNLQVMDS